MEIASMLLNIGAKVSPALDGLSKVDSKMVQSASTAQTQGGKMTKFLDKVKAGWVAVGAMGAGVLYAFVKNSPVFAAYFQEFGEMIGMIGDTLALALQPVLDPLLDLLWKFADWFDKIPGPLKAFIAILLGLAIAIPVIVGIITALNPITLIIMAIIAIVLLLYAAWEGNWLGIRDILTNVWSIIVSTITRAIDIIKGIIQWFVDFFSAIWSGNWDKAGQLAMQALTAIGNFFKDIFLGIINFLANLGGKIFEAGVNFVKWLVQGIMSVAHMIADAIWNILPDWLKWLIENAASLIGGVAKGIGEWWAGLAGAQLGGYVMRTGPIVAHAGERIIPAGSTSTASSTVIDFHPNVYITGSIGSSESDIRKNANKISEIWRDDLRRLIR